MEQETYREIKTMKLDEAPKQKERHIVRWTPQEDDLLREQVSTLGTESWTAIAGQFKDKTSRQCRRRWYTYLNTECKKGGWTPEEDRVLCEAQKMYGNKWTEIAKVVSGRTDNAVKNRFTTLCKKQVKHEALSKENDSIFVNPNNKRLLFQDGISESTAELKKIRTHIVDLNEKGNTRSRFLWESGTDKQRLRSPLAVLVQNFNNEEDLQGQHHILGNNEAGLKHALNNYIPLNNNIQGTFLEKDDPKIITTLMQQEELLSSLALKLISDSTSQSLENAWKLQDFLIRTKENEMLGNTISEMDFPFKDSNDLIQDLQSGSPRSQLSWRQPNLQEVSQGSSEYSSGSSNQSHSEDHKIEQYQAEECSFNQKINNVLDWRSVKAENVDGCQDGFGNNKTGAQATTPFCEEEKDSDESLLVFPTADFSSPVQMIPPFRYFVEGIPSPKFSESERQYLLRTLCLASPSVTAGPKLSQPPPCRRALLHSL